MSKRRAVVAPIGLVPLAIQVQYLRFIVCFFRHSTSPNRV
jgi:hypothetical protein